MAADGGTYLDSLFQTTCFLAGVKVGTSSQWNYSSGFSVTYNNTTKQFDVTLSGTSPASTFPSLTVTGTTTLDGNIVHGPTTDGVASGLTTSGTGSVTLKTFSLPTNSVVGLDFVITAVSGSSYGYIQRSAEDTGANTLGGTLTTSGSPAVTTGNFPIQPTTASGWAAGTLTITGAGPGTLTVTGCADNGSGKVRVTVSDALLTTTLTGLNVTIAGVVGTTEANGTHAATFVNATHFDLASVNFVNAYVSGGTVVLTTPLAITWAIDMQLRARTP